jgi:large subunit ribosomal protein L15
MQQELLRPPRGSKRPRKRVGRGNASGNGTYAGKGMKGQQARAGSGPHPGFEGGQTPLIRRLPVRRGFRNPSRVPFEAVNLRDFAKLPNGVDVTQESLRSAGVINSARLPVKVLATGDISMAYTVRVHRVSETARAKIEAAGGSVEELAPREKKVRNRKHRRAVAQAPTSEEASDEQGEREESSNEKDKRETDGSSSETSKSSASD